MHYIISGFCFFAGVFFASPAALLAKIAWKDRKLPRDHPDYVGVWMGKKIVYVGILTLSLLSVAFLWGARWWYVLN